MDTKLIAAQVITIFFLFPYLSTGFSLSVGPVLGLITDTSVKILIETVIATTVSFHLFALDSYAQEGNYLFSEVPILAPFHHPLTLPPESLHSPLPACGHDNEKSLSQLSIRSVSWRH
jgi:hypothetical protein